MLLNDSSFTNKSQEVTVAQKQVSITERIKWTSSYSNVWGCWTLLFTITFLLKDAYAFGM